MLISSFLSLSYCQKCKCPYRFILFNSYNSQEKQVCLPFYQVATTSVPYILSCIKHIEHFPILLFYLEHYFQKLESYYILGLFSFTVFSMQRHLLTALFKVIYSWMYFYHLILVSLYFLIRNYLFYFFVYSLNIISNFYSGRSLRVGHDCLTQ